MVTPHYVKVFVCKISTDIKKSGTQSLAVQKIDFGESIWGVLETEWYPQTMSK